MPVDANETLSRPRSQKVDERSRIYLNWIWTYGHSPFLHFFKPPPQVCVTLCNVNQNLDLKNVLTDNENDLRF